MLSRPPIVVLKTLVLLIAAGVALNASAVWWDTNWDYRLALDVTESSGAPVTNQQFLVTVDSSSFHTDYVWSTNGDDIRFVDALTGNSLSYMVRSWDAGSETAILMVLIPTLAANETRRLHLYYENPAAPAASDPVAVLTEPGLLYHTRYTTVDPTTLTEARNEFYSLDDSVAGYGCTNLTDFTLVNNQNLFGPPNNGNNIAFVSNHHFEVTAATAGTWYFRFGGDYGYGGGMYVDGVTLEEDWNDDRWWDFNWSNTAETFDGNITLTEGWHTLELMGFEGCCDGGTSVEFRSPAAPGTWRTWSTSNANIRSEKCLPDSSPATPFPTNLSTSTHVAVDQNGGDVEVGDVIRYTLTLTDTGGAEAELVEILADMPPGVGTFTVISVPAGAMDGSSAMGGANSTGQLAVTAVNIPANSSVTLIYEYTVGTVPGGTALEVSATGTHPTGSDDFSLPANGLITALDAVPLSNIIKHLYLDDTPEMSRLAPTSNQNQITLWENQSETWTLDPSLQTDLVIDSAATEIRTSLYLRETWSGSSRDMRITISGSDSGTIAQEEFYNVSLTNAFQLIPFNVDIVGSPPATLDAGEEIEITLTHLSGSGFRLLHIRPSDGTTHSVIEFPTDTAINIEDIEIYDAAWPAGSLKYTFAAGDTVYVRTTVSDPFGAFDITAANIDIQDPSAGYEVTDASMTEITTSPWPSASEKLYEYAYTLSGSAPSGTWDIEIRADEGLEGTVQHNAGSGFTVAGNLEMVLDSGTGSASTCSPYTLNVRMEDGTGMLDAGYLGTINFTTTSGNGTWTTSGNGPLTETTPNDGIASYDFVVLDGGEASFALSSVHADDLQVTVTDTANSLSETSSTISFRDNRFEIVEADVLDTDIVAGRNHTFSVTLVRRDSGTGNCGTATDYTGVMPTKAWITRDGMDPGGTAPGVIADSTLALLPNSTPGANNLDIEFVAGVGNLTLTSSDVGRLTLNLVDDTSGYAVDILSNPLTISSSATGAPWTVRPFAIRIVAVGNPAAATPTDATFVTAGSDFAVQVSGVRYQAADDNGVAGGTANDGIADSPAELIDNTVTPSFGAEGESVTLSSSLLLPNPGVDPGLSGASLLLNSFVGGTDTATYQFNEVGIIVITAAVTDGGYLGTTAPITQKLSVGSGNIGRFYPSHFNVTNTVAGTFDAACSSGSPYTYVGQNFGFGVAPAYLIEPRNNADTATLNNYQGTFAHLTAAEVTIAHPTADGSNGIAVTTSANTGTLLGNGDGSLTLTLSLLDQFSYTRGAAVEPFATDLTITMTAINETLDSVAANGLPEAATPAATSLRYGRVRLDNAFGPETEGLVVPGVVEYFVGGSYQTNPDDGCTSFAGTLSTSPTGSPPGSLSGINVGGGTTTLLANATSVAGDIGMSLLAPGAGNTGDVTISLDLSLLPFLQFDYNGDGSNDTVLTRIATLGQYRGHDRIIYWREVKN